MSERTSQLNNTMEIGDKAGGNLTKFETTGFMKCEGDALAWTDLRVPLEATTQEGSNPPIKAVFKTDSDVEPNAGNALSFLSNSSGLATVPDNGVYDWESDWTINMWVYVTPSTQSFRSLIYKENLFNVRYWNGSILALDVFGMGFNTTNIQMNVNAWNMISVTFEDLSTNVAKLYINGNEGAEIQSQGSPVNNANDIVFNSDTAIFNVDQTAIYDKTLSQAEITAAYNSGAGVGLVGNEANVVGLWKFDSQTGTTVTDSTSTGNDGTISGTENNDFEWIDGHVGTSAPTSRGVKAWFFPAGQLSELEFSVQLPHDWKEGSEIRPHAHWVKVDGGGGDFEVEFEYTKATPITGTFGNTVVNTKSATITGETIDVHNIFSFDPIDMTGDKLSTMLICRLARNLDTYTGDLVLLEFDFHYQRDTRGSRQEFIK